MYITVLTVQLSPVVWESRVRSIIEAASGFLNSPHRRPPRLVVVVPILVYSLAEDDYNDDYTITGSLISNKEVLILGVTAGIWLFVSVPHTIWKVLGRIRICKLALQWKEDDARRNTLYPNIPPWRATMPGVYRDSIVRSQSESGSAIKIVVPVQSVQMYIPPVIKVSRGGATL
ncbi:hypothetical protein PAXINDRAFT_179397 [Paxillus involutus ATCC 200175]|nr:hypothetical protein PAXINDRAFT_179397 [Paxillus involutus ATCC 200175]